MFDVVSCPKCSGRVTLPEGAPQHGWVRCPICRAEYQAHHLLNFHPPELEVIDEPAKPSAGRLPDWGAVAAANPAMGSAPTASEIAAPAADSIDLEATDELAVAPIDTAARPISSAEVGDDSDVFTFDDSLLLDEPTGKLPYAEYLKAAEAAAQPAGVAVSDVDFLADDSSEIASADRAQSAGEIDRRDDEPHRPPPLAGEADAPMADGIRGTETHWSAKTVLDRGAPAPLTSMPQIGLAPRRKSRRRSPILTVIGILAGGFLGIPLGYLILLWLPLDPPKDPFNIAPKLPGFMVPEALRSTSEERVARFPTDDKSDNVAPVLDETTGNGDSKNSQPGGQEPASSQPFGDSAAEQGRSNVESLPTPLINPGDPTNTQSKATPSGTPTVEKDPLTDLFGDPSATETKTDTGQPVFNPVEAAATEVKTDSQALATDSTADPTATLPADPIESLGPLGDKRYTRQDLLSALAAAKLTTERALAVPVDAPAAQKKKVNVEFYMNLCKIAEAVTFFERSATRELDKATTAAIEALLNAVPDQRRLEEIGKLAGYWFSTPKGNGIVLTGMVKQSNPRGKLVESIVETLGTSPPRPITVVSPSALTDDPGRPVLVAGTIVKDAAKNLRGYEGTAETVVWAAIAIDPSNRTAVPKP